MKVLLVMPLDLLRLLLLVMRPDIRRRHILLRPGHLHPTTAGIPIASIIEPPLILPVDLLLLLLWLGLRLRLLQVGEVVVIVGQLLARKRVRRRRRRRRRLLRLLLRKGLGISRMALLLRMVLLVMLLCLRVLRLAEERRLPLRQGACVGHDGDLMGRAMGETKCRGRASFSCGRCSCGSRASEVALSLVVSRGRFALTVDDSRFDPRTPRERSSREVRV